MRLFILLALLAGAIGSLYTFNFSPSNTQYTATQEQPQSNSDFVLPVLNLDQLNPLLLQADNTSTGMFCAPAFCESDDHCACGVCGDDNLCTR